MSPPAPFHVLRNHAHPIHDVFLSPSSPLLYAGDEDGHVSVTDLTIRRVVAFWKAHEGGVLGVGEWEGRLISHGRDNLIHIYEPIQLASASTTSSSASSTLTPLLAPPAIQSSLDVNALNFCRFSVAEWPAENKGKARATEDEDRAFIAVPNLTDSESVDIYALPSLARVHAAVAHNAKSPPPSADPTAAPRSGLIMALHLHFSPDGELWLVIAFEDGRVELWACVAAGSRHTEREESEELPVWQTGTDSRLNGQSGAMPQGARWHKVWRDKVHNEAIMAMCVFPKQDYAFSVSADHQLVRYTLERGEGSSAASSDRQNSNAGIKVASTKQIGNSSVAVMPDGRVVAVGGWDGNVRLFSTKSLKPLGTLPYHRQSVDAIAFVQAELSKPALPEDLSAVDLAAGIAGAKIPSLERWMITGSKDRRVALWELKDFERK